MDQQLVQDWSDFCDGKSDFTPEHFSQLFIELYLDPLTASDLDNLRTIFSFIPNSRRAIEKMIRLNERADDRHDDEIIALVNSDLREMQRIIDLESVRKAMAVGHVEITLDEQRFQNVCNSDLNGQFFHALSSFFFKEMATDRMGKIRALSNAFYGLASSVHLQWAMTADVLEVDARFDNYFELYLIGVDYALDEEGITIMNYRAKMAESSGK